MAGAAGLEPTHDGVKVRCLTDLATPLLIGEHLVRVCSLKTSQKISSCALGLLMFANLSPVQSYKIHYGSSLAPLGTKRLTYVLVSPIGSQQHGSLLKSSPRPISTSQLHGLLHFHIWPIYLVVYKGPYFFRMTDLILRLVSRLDAFSVYPFRT